MSFEHIIIYGIALLVVLKIFFFFRKIYKNRIRKVVFPKKVLKEEWEENQKDNERYKEKKQKELIKRQETLRESQKNDDIQVYHEDLEIVDIAKPVGKWTQMVMLGGGLMKRLAQLINREGGQKGYWELFVKAQASTQGKYKGKGR
ncbi:hypothetical protein [Wolbachia endosymbiont of Folsomia candida]|uniref:hypothetical protein n=1 Tax=Wolbachia endosymbiont of Folsomia candida TaxID=169402 RepID=UPI000B2DD982|nr:hypothetical protein [Wolbachia endosymbiont of Folsomia candida]APR98345.1 hypothetical protein ASM33_03545 [Wolbachia endosymbiont of Folsomia candida]